MRALRRDSAVGLFAPDYCQFSRKLSEISGLKQAAMVPGLR
jgi:hypothetical protein